MVIFKKNIVSFRIEDEPKQKLLLRALKNNKSIGIYVRDLVLKDLYRK